MDIELDLLLEDARPPVAARTPGLSEAVGALLAAAEPAAAGPTPRLPRAVRRRLRAASYALAAATIVGGGAAAHAAGWLLPQPENGRSWDDDSAAVRVDITLEGGKRCEAVYMVVPVETKAGSASPELWDAVWSAATSYLADVDRRTLTSTEVIEDYRAEALAQHRLAERTLPASEVSPVPSENEIRVNAPGAALKSMIDVELRRHDLPTDLLVMTSGDNCTPGARE